MKDPWFLQRWAFEQQTGNSVRKSVLSMLAMMADANTGRCEAKQATLAAGVEVSERAVRGHLKALEESGFIVRRAQYRRDHGRRGDEYLLLAPGVDEWPDGEPARPIPADRAGGSGGVDLPGGAEAGSRTPRKPASGQELPPVNGQKNGETSSTAREACWVGVDDEMRHDAQALLANKTTVGSRLVTEREVAIAAAALAEYNRQAGADFGLGAQLVRIVGRVRERPSWDAAKHVRLVQSAWRIRWWEKRSPGKRPTPQVIYGNAEVFERVAQDAADEAHGRQVDLSSLNGAAGRLKGYVWPDGRTWDELTPTEQMVARQNAAMDVWPDQDRAAAPDRPAAAGEAWTAETFGQA